MDPFDDMDTPVFTPPIQGDQAPKTRIVKFSDGSKDMAPDPSEYCEGAAPMPKRYRGRFQPGQTGNPLGRPPSFRAMINEATADGAELVAYAIGVLRGEVKNTITGVSKLTGEPWVEQVECSVPVKWAALEYLTERSQGREAAKLDVTSKGEQITGSPSEEIGPDLSKLTIEELRLYMELRRKTSRAPKAKDEIVDAEVVDA